MFRKKHTQNTSLSQTENIQLSQIENIQLSQTENIQLSKTENTQLSKTENPLESKEAAELKKTSSSLSYFKSLFPKNILSIPKNLTNLVNTLSIPTNLENLVKNSTYFNLIANLPKTAAKTLFLLVEGVNYAARSDYSPVLGNFESKAINTCPSQLTILDGPQGNYTDFSTMSCMSPEDSLTFSIMDSNNTEPLLKCAIDFINDYNGACDSIEAQTILMYAALGLIGVTLGCAFLIKSCQKMARSPEPAEIERANTEQVAPYRPLSPGR